VKTVDITNFSGGIHEAVAPSDFTDRQWTQIKGFILQDETRMKTQWPIQRIGSETGFSEVRPLVAGDGTKFLVGIKTNGEIWATTAPANSASYTTTAAASWTRLTSINGASTVVVGNASAHFLCETTLQVSAVNSNTKTPALLINQSETIGTTYAPLYVWAASSASIGVYRNITSLSLTVTNRTIASLVATLTFSTSHQFKVGDTITVASVATDYNGTRTVTAIPNSKQVSFATAGANEAPTASTGTVTGDTAAVHPGYVPVAPSNVTLVQSGGNVVITWTAEYAGSSGILGWDVYSATGVLLTTTAAATTTATVAGLVADGFIVRGFNAYGKTPFDAEGGVLVPANGYVPLANVGTMWAGQLILGDIEYYKDAGDIAKQTQLSPLNSTRARNAIWFSNPEFPSQFDPLSVFILGNPDTVITGFTVLPQGLLVTTVSNNNDTGIYLLRGTNAGLIVDDKIQLGFSIELVRGGVSSPMGSIYPGNIVTLWPSVGTVAFLDNKSLVWQTNTQQLGQLDLYGAIPPAQYATSDCIATWDRYLFVSRGGRFLVMREFGSEGSWTEIALPSGLTATSLTEIGNSMYFVGTGDANGYVWRVNLYPTGDAANEYGRSNNTLLDLTITTRPVGEPNRFDKSFWHRIGVRARGGNGAVCKSVESWNGSPLVTGTSSLLTTTFSPSKSVAPRFEVVVPAHGPSIEAAARIVFTGYIEVEAVTFYVHGKKPVRP